MISKPISKTLALILMTIIILLLCSLVWILAIAQTVSASTVDQITATATPRIFCRVQYLVRIREGVSLNVRPTPSRNTTPTQQINGTQNPYSAVWTDGSWFELCSINRQYISGDPQYVTFVTVTPQPPTPTRLATNTPIVATATPQPSYTWMAIDTEGDGVLTLIRCLNPCKIVYSDREPTP